MLQYMCTIFVSVAVAIAHPEFLAFECIPKDYMSQLPMITEQVVRKDGI